MKNILLTAAGLASIAIASPALADGDNTGVDTTTLTVNASTPAKCDITANETTVSLGAYDITNDQGRARNNVGNKVAQALNGLNIKGWCTGANNSFVLTRSALVLNESDGNPVDGFNTAVIYDIEVAVENATRTNGSPVDEGTSDGNIGPVVGHFGPTGAGSKLTFQAEPENSTSSAVENGQAGQLAARSSYNESNARLIAGDYTGTVVIEVTPSV